MARIAKKTGTYHHGDLRRVLLDTAVRVVEKEGIAALSLLALTRRAGVSTAAPYHHFQNREQLLAAIALEGFDLLAAEMKRSAHGAHGAGNHLAGLGRGYIRFALAHRGHFRVMFRPELLQNLVVPEGTQTPREAFGMLERAIERCQEEGLAPPGDPTALKIVAWSAVHGASVLWIDGPLSLENFVQNEDELADLVAKTVTRLFASFNPAQR